MIEKTSILISMLHSDDLKKIWTSNYAVLPCSDDSKIMMSSKLATLLHIDDSKKEGHRIP